MDRWDKMETVFGGASDCTTPRGGTVFSLWLKPSSVLLTLDGRYRTGWLSTKEPRHHVHHGVRIQLIQQQFSARPPNSLFNAECRPVILVFRKIRIWRIKKIRKSQSKWTFCTTFLSLLRRAGGGCTHLEMSSVCIQPRTLIYVLSCIPRLLFPLVTLLQLQEEKKLSFLHEKIVFSTKLMVFFLINKKADVFSNKVSNKTMSWIKNIKQWYVVFIL